MKRRQMFQVLAAAPAAGVAIAQSPGATPPPSDELPKLDNAAGETVGTPATKFFSPAQMAALRTLSGLLMPAMKGNPGAIEAGVPEFLDFLAGVSNPERQQLYRAGLDALNIRSAKQYQRPYSQLDPAQAGSLLTPLNQPWIADGPADDFARFLRQARQDVRAATQNSREWALAMASGGPAPGGGGRRGGGGGGLGLYWHPLE